MSLLKLQQMINSGKTYYYRNLPTVIKSFDATHPGAIKILAEIDGKPHEFIKENEDKISLFMANFSEVPVIDVPEEPNTNLPANQHPKSDVPQLYIETKTMFATLAKGLVDDVEKVRADPNYIPRAKQVCNNVNAIVNIARLQFMLLHQKE